MPVAGTDDITTDEVIITDEQIQHIKDRHPGDYERFFGFFDEIISDPDYIIEARKPNTAILLKEVQIANEFFKLVLRLVVPTDNPNYKNSIITFMKIDKKTLERLIRNKKVLYKRKCVCYNRYRRRWALRWRISYGPHADGTDKGKP